MKDDRLPPPRTESQRQLRAWIESLLDQPQFDLEVTLKENANKFGYTEAAFRRLINAVKQEREQKERERREEERAKREEEREEREEEQREERERRREEREERLAREEERRAKAERDKRLRAFD